MNKRIKELVERSTTYEKGPPNWSMTDNTEIKVFDTEKFAELIIKECAAIANRAENDEFWTKPVGDLIKEHFGVK